MPYPHSVWFWVIWGFITACIFSKYIGTFGCWVMEKFSEPFPEQYNYECWHCNKGGESCPTCPYKELKTKKGV